LSSRLVARTIVLIKTLFARTVGTVSECYELR
jgi:hypothetical protein